MRTSLMARALVVVFFAFGLFANAAHAQSTNAAVGGQITDEQGRVVPGVTVVLTNLNTGVTYQPKTNGDGFYNAPNLPPGIYRANVTKDGFKSIVKGDIELHVQDVASINFQLQVGSITETVTVEAGGLVINTTDATVSTVVDRQFAENLPLNGRSFQTLIALTPGVVLTPANTLEAGQFSVNGQRADANYFTVDGVSANVGTIALIGSGQASGGALPGFSGLGGTNSLVSVDALEEFRVQTSTFAPEFGRTPGGQISIVTRSGTNAYHGTLFDYLRNDALDANDWFGDANLLPKPQERQNDFGGTFNGPIVKNKTFFFFSYEGLRLHQPQTLITTVPSLAVRQAAPAPVQLLMNAFPIPNGPELTDGFAQFASSYSDPAKLDAVSLRVDHRFKESITVFGRYNYAPSEVTQRASANGAASSVLSDPSTAEFNTQTLTFGLTLALSKVINNEVRANYSKQTASLLFKPDTFGGAKPPGASALLPSFVSPANATFFVDFGPTQWGVGGASVKNEQRQFNLVDNISITSGKHQLRFGLDFRRLPSTSAPNAYEEVVGFTSPADAVSGTTQFAVIFAAQRANLVSSNISVYAQDTWKTTPRLAVTYGLRWDVNPALHGQDGTQVLAAQGVTNPATLSLAPPGTPLYHTTYLNLAPRIGVAYQLAQNSGRETVLRAGFGIFYDLGVGSLGGLAGTFPFTALKVFLGVPYPLTPAMATPPPFTTGPVVTGNLLAADPNLQLPRTYQWNVAVERSLGTNQTVSATYVGAAGRRLLLQHALVQPNPNIQGALLTTNGGTSDYDALQLQYQRRLSRGLQALASYSWSHSIDTASNDSSSLGPVSSNGDRGPSDFDIRHSFTSALNYDIPRPNLGIIGRAVFRDWSTDAFFLVRTAVPVDLAASTASFPTTNASVRPDLVPGEPLYLFDSSFAGGKRFNPAAFTTPPTDANGFALRQGDVSRNLLRGFGAWQLDLALRRSFPLGDKVNLQFRAELFNLFNHPNFASPVSDIGNPLFGQSIQMLGRSLGSGGSAGGLNPLYQIGGPRSVQLALKLQF
jgi:hypothetical protein